MDGSELTLSALHSLWIVTSYHGSARGAESLAAWHREHKVSRTWPEVERVAEAIADWRGSPPLQHVSSYLAARLIADHPGEHGDLYYWAAAGGGGLGRTLIDGAWTMPLWVERIVMAYLLGLDVSEDVHVVCVAAGLSSSLSPSSRPVRSPCGGLPDDEAMGSLLRRHQLD